METRHFVKNLCKQKVKKFFLSTLIVLNPKRVPRYKDVQNPRHWLLLLPILYSYHLQKMSTRICQIRIPGRS